jgi:hypothetical protein
MRPVRDYDEVELRGSKDGKSIVVFLRRSTAVAQRTDLERDGWSCDILEVDRDGVSVGPGAAGRLASERRMTWIVHETSARLARRTGDVAADVTRLASRLVASPASRGRVRDASPGDAEPLA